MCEFENVRKERKEKWNEKGEWKPKFPGVDEAKLFRFISFA